jgi:hypothetical protein
MSHLKRAFKEEHLPMYVCMYVNVNTIGLFVNYLSTICIITFSISFTVLKMYIKYCTYSKYQYKNTEEAGFIYIRT